MPVLARGSPLLTSLLLGLLLLSALPLSAEEPVLIATGCESTLNGFMRDVASVYEAHSGVAIVLSGGGATHAIRETNAGNVHMGGASRPSLPGRFPEEEGQVYLTVAGWDAIVPIVHPSNPVDSLTSAQLKQILNGTITRWSKLGGSDVPIKIIVRQGKITGVGYTIRRLLFDDPELEFPQSAIVLSATGPIETKVATTAGGIALTGLASARSSPVKILAVNGEVPSAKTVATGNYRLFCPLYIATRGAPSGQTKLFLDWLVGPRGQAAVTDAGIVSLEAGGGLKERFRGWGPRERVLNWSQLN